MGFLWYIHRESQRPVVNSNRLLFNLGNVNDIWRYSTTIHEDKNM